MVLFFNMYTFAYGERKCMPCFKLQNLCVLDVTIHNGNVCNALNVAL